MFVFFCFVWSDIAFYWTTCLFWNILNIIFKRKIGETKSIKNEKKWRLVGGDENQISAFPNAISREPEFSPKNLGNVPSPVFGNILFPVPTQYRHSGLAFSQLVWGWETFGNSRTLPYWKLIILISALVKIFPIGTDLFIKFSTRQYKHALLYNEQSSKDTE